MKKTISVALTIAVLGTAFFSIFFIPQAFQNFLYPGYYFGKELVLIEGLAIEVDSPEFVHLGDEFSYKITVFYHQANINSIDKAGFADVAFSPFELKTFGEKEFMIDPYTKAYQREYIVQAIDGNTNTLYDFGNLTLKYQKFGSQDWLERTAVLKPVFLSARIPETYDPRLSLIPPAGRIIDFWETVPIYSLLIVFTIGFGAAGGFMIFWRLRPRKKVVVGIAWQEKVEATLGALKQKISQGQDLRDSGQRLYNILMLVFARLGFSPENPDSFPEEIRARAKTALENLERSFSEEGPSQEELIWSIAFIEEVIKNV